MFTRLSNKINTTLFNLSSTSDIEKLKLFNNLLKDAKEDMKSIHTTKAITTLSSVNVIPEWEMTTPTSSPVIKAMLFNDIVGLRTTESEPEYISKIFNQRGIIRKGALSYNTSEESETNSINVLEAKTASLLKTYHKQDITNLQKTSKIPITFAVDNESEKRGHVIRQAPFKKKVAGEELLPVLARLDHLLLVEGVCTLSEVAGIVDIMLQLRNSCLYRIYPLQSVLDYLDISDIVNSLYKKYFNSNSNAYEQLRGESRTSKLGNRDITYMEARSLHYECMDNTSLVNDELNVFIPFKFYVFLGQTAEMFNPINTVIVEETVITSPRAFTSAYSTPKLGAPKYFTAYAKMTKGENYRKQQTSTKLLPNITTNKHTLKNTITYIPANLTQRLLKSKLKVVKDNRLVLSEFGDKVYNIPKSILDNKYMEDFYFFKPEQVKTIDKAKELDVRFRFYITPEGMVSVDYYTNHIRNWLVNRFASDSYDNILRVSDFLAYPKILYPEEIPLDKMLSELEVTQNKATAVFNTDQLTLITKEMLIYEKACLLMSYLIKKTCGKTFGLNSLRYESFTNIIKLIKENQGNFTYDTLRMFNESVGGNTVEVGMDKKAYLLEFLFILCYEKTTEEVIKTIEKIEQQTIVFARRDMEEIKQTLKSTFEKYLRTVQPRGRDDLYRLINKVSYLKLTRSLSNRICFILSEEKSPSLVSIIFSRTIIYNFIKLLQHDVEFLVNILNGRELKRDGTSVRITFLGDAIAQRDITRNSWANPEKSHPVLMRIFNESSTKKNTDLGVFLNMLLTNLSEDYLSTIKTEQ